VKVPQQVLLALVLPKAELCSRLLAEQVRQQVTTFLAILSLGKTKTNQGDD
jgi:hypothetical protein